MPKRRPSPRIRHRDIVIAQTELLNWCHNVAAVSKEDLEWVCWACGANPPARENVFRPTIPHIVRYKPDEVECANNLILLCDACHREQPDAVPKDVLKYWLRTRESAEQRFEHCFAPLRAAVGILVEEFGEFVVRVGQRELFDDKPTSEFPASVAAANGYAENSAGQGSGNREANRVWGVFAELREWCRANAQRVEDDFRRFQAAFERARARDKQQFLFDL
jgi:hypothetical protein